MRGEAFSAESIARRGRTFRIYIVGDGDWMAVRAAKGPIRREDAGTPARIDSIRSPHQDSFLEPWEGRRSLRVTLTGSGWSADKDICNRIAELSRLGHLTVYACPSVPSAELPTSVRRLEYLVRDGAYCALTATGEEGRTRYFHVPVDAALQMEQSVSESDGIMHGPSEPFVVDLAAHRALNADFLISANPHVLSRRTGNKGLFSPVGTASPREGLTVVEAFLRRKDIFVLDAHHGWSTETDAGSFFGAVVRGLCPTLMEALRHCLDPANSDDSGMAKYLQGIVSRLGDLLVAADELGHLAQLEGYMGGNNTILDRQLYHLQNSVVLFSGCLEMLAWTVAGLCRGELPERRLVSWGNLNKPTPPAWVAQASDPRTQAALAAVRAIDKNQIDDVIALRDTYQHRLPLPNSALVVSDNFGIEKTRIGGIECAAVELEPEFYSNGGIFEAGEFQFMMPHSYQRGFIGRLVSTIETVLSAVEWPDTGWWMNGPPMTDLDSEATARIAAWLFGPLT